MDLINLFILFRTFGTLLLTQRYLPKEMDPNILLSDTDKLEHHVHGLVDAIASRILAACELEKNDGLRSGTKRLNVRGPSAALHISQKACEARQVVSECVQNSETYVGRVKNEASLARSGGIVLKNKDAEEYEDVWSMAAKNQSRGAVDDIVHELQAMSAGNSFRGTSNF